MTGQSLLLPIAPHCGASGSGYSSLNMLTKLPIDALKLDMQFVRTAFGEKKDTRLLEAMMQLADAFRLAHRPG